MKLAPNRQKLVWLILIHCCCGDYWYLHDSIFWLPHGWNNECYQNLERMFYWYVLSTLWIIQWCKTCESHLNSSIKLSTKNSQMLNIPHFRSTSGQRRFYYRTVTLWNSLFKEVKVCESTHHFKHDLKKQLLHK